MDLVAQSDQIQASLRTMAVMCAAFREALTDQGFTKEQAQQMVQIWLHNVTEIREEPV